MNVLVVFFACTFVWYNLFFHTERAILQEKPSQGKLCIWRRFWTFRPRRWQEMRAHKKWCIFSRTLNMTVLWDAFASDKKRRLVVFAIANIGKIVLADRGVAIIDLERRGWILERKRERCINFSVMWAVAIYPCFARFNFVIFS